jgi:hypothetical protein
LRGNFTGLGAADAVGYDKYAARGVHQIRIFVEWPLSR